MSIAVCGCQCGTTESLLRDFLQANGYRDWLSIPIPKGHEASNRLIESLPPYEELKLLKQYLEDKGTWAVVIGMKGNGCRWADLAHATPKERIEAEFVVRNFA